MANPLTPPSRQPCIDRITSLIETLRGEDGCPWDRKQTPETIARYIIEESYELVDAIMSGQTAAVCEEAGDVLFQLLFVIILYRERGQFDLGDVADRNLEKMIRRHPHVFGGETAETPEEVKENWDKIKRSEKRDSGRTSVLDGIPQSIPALLRADMVSRRAAATGFDWDSIGGVMDKAMEEWREFQAEVDTPRPGQRQTPAIDPQRAADEFGDVLFTMVNVARFANVNPETALVRAIQKFEQRFRFMETESLTAGKRLEDLSFDEMHLLWDQAKLAMR